MAVSRHQIHCETKASPRRKLAPSSRLAIKYYTEHIIQIAFQLSPSAGGHKSLTQQLQKFRDVTKCFEEGKDSEVGRRTKEQEE